ncbi:hypothetical protein EVAR_86402_1 [Eumeta japonica]|uniref:Uncharacterized protein n=1 Tax=Eumeta variegata TaxID=151549 RepID=A0A4C1W8X3_EUMVA|nr:hypothetical protein EVAR_86402_1 [Eumeta japonica]
MILGTVSSTNRTQAIIFFAFQKVDVASTPGFRYPPRLSSARGKADIRCHRRADDVRRQRLNVFPRAHDECYKD